MVSALTLDDISSCNDTELLLSGLRECAESLLSNIMRTAAIVRRLDELGVEVAIENSLLPYIRLIAHGQMSANLFVALSGDPPLLEKAIRLPIPVQDQIANNEPFKVCELGGDHRMVRPLDMTARERNQVFRGKRLRTDAEQVGFLREHMERDAIKNKPDQERLITLDRRRNGIVVNGLFIPVAELAGYIASLNS